MHRKLISQLQGLFDLLCGVEPMLIMKPLPPAYFQQPDWLSEAQALQMPAAWRRQPRIR